MASGSTSAAALLREAEDAWSSGDGAAAASLFGRAFRAAEAARDAPGEVAAALGLARTQQYGVTPGSLPVRLNAAAQVAEDPQDRARLAAALARCWAYANEPTRAAPFATRSLTLARDLADPLLEADALDAVLAAHWGPDDLTDRRAWALRLGDVSAHVRDPDSRLQAHLWELTVAWEVLDLPRMHRSMRAIELLGEESARARFFAASRRLPLDLLRDRTGTAGRLVAEARSAAAVTAIPDADPVLSSMRAYAAYFSGDAAGCAALAPAFEEFAHEQGAAAIRAEAAIIWLGAGRLDKVAEMVGAFTPAVLADLPSDCDWLLTMQCVLEGALAVTDREVVAGVTALLRPYVGRSVVNGGAVMWHGVTDDPVGRALALLGEAPAAEQCLDAAFATYERIGARWWRDRLRRARPSTHQVADRRMVHLHEQAGGLWLVGPSTGPVVLPRMRGLEHLRVLVANPGTEVAALDLAGPQAVRQSGLDLLDDEARAAYRARIAHLDALLDGDGDGDGSAAPGDPWEAGSADPMADSGLAALRRERDAIAAELAHDTGLAGRGRRVGSTDERARVAVRKAIVAALARIAQDDPWLARHLHDHVRTGSHCRYDPDPDVPVTWLLR